MQKTRLKPHGKPPFPFRMVNVLGQTLNTLGLHYPVLTSASMQRFAASKIGLDDFGDPYYLDGLEALLASGNHGDITFLGRYELQLIARECLMNRLQWVAKTRQFGYDFGCELRPPVVITGLYRTGTTILHRLLDCAHDMRGLSAWELMKPFPPENGKKDNRRKFIAQQLKLFNMMRPELRHKHEITVDDPEECTMGQGFTFTSHFFIDSLPVFGYLDWYNGYDRTKMYHEYGSMLHWYQSTDARRIVLKSPSHTADIGLLKSAIPEACIVQTHRDPVETVCSTLSLFHTDQSLYMSPYRLEDFVRSIVGMLRHMADENVRYRKAHPHHDVLDIRYDDIVADPKNCAERICHHFDIQVTARDQAEMQSYLDRTPHGRHGKHVYHPEEYGLTHDEIYSWFEEYDALT